MQERYFSLYFLACSAHSLGNAGQSPGATVPNYYLRGKMTTLTVAFCDSIYYVQQINRTQGFF